MAMNPLNFFRRFYPKAPSHARACAIQAFQNEIAIHQRDLAAAHENGNEAAWSFAQQQIAACQAAIDNLRNRDETD